MTAGVRNPDDAATPVAPRNGSKMALRPPATTADNSRILQERVSPHPWLGWGCDLLFFSLVRVPPLTVVFRQITSSSIRRSGALIRLGRLHDVTRRCRRLTTCGSSRDDVSSSRRRPIAANEPYSRSDDSTRTSGDGRRRAPHWGRCCSGVDLLSHSLRDPCRELASLGRPSSPAPASYQRMTRSLATRLARRLFRSTPTVQAAAK